MEEDDIGWACSTRRIVKNLYKILIIDVREKRKRRWEDNIKMCIK
jgi:hypothetical protein